jgi:hypothetical protein
MVFILILFLAPGASFSGTRIFHEDFMTSVNRNNSASTETGWSTASGSISLPPAVNGYIVQPSGVPGGLSNYLGADSGDLDGDGLDDLILVGTNGAITILRQSSSFTVPLSVANADNTDIWDVVTADFNEDGNLDFATLDDNGEVRIWLNALFLNFVEVYSFTNSYAAGAAEKSLSVGEFQNSTRSDLFVGGIQKQTGKYYVRIYENDLSGTGTFVYQSSNLLKPGDIVHMVAMGDFDNSKGNDKSDDILTAESGANDWIRLMNTDVSGNFQTPIDIDTVSSLTDVEVFDLDGDGYDDFVTSVGANSNAGWYESDGAGGFTYHNYLDSSGGTLSLAATTDLAIGDFNSDGVKDVFYLHSSDGNIRWVLSDSTSGYAASATAFSIDVAEVLPTGSAITSANVTVSDDGTPDICGAMNNEPCIKYYLLNLDSGSKVWLSPDVAGNDSVTFFDTGSELYFGVELYGDGTFTPEVYSINIQYTYSGDRYIYRSESVVDRGERVLVQGSFKEGVNQGMIEVYDLNVIPPARIGNPITGNVSRAAGWQIYTSDGLGGRQFFNSTTSTLTALQVTAVRNLQLGGIDHSAPAIVRGVVFPAWYYLNPDPDEKTTFDDFFAAHKDRTTYWFIPANDGMMHTFDGKQDSTSFMDELWTYVPSAYKNDMDRNLDADLTNDLKIEVGGTLVDIYDPGVTPPVTSTYRTLLAFPVGNGRNDIVGLDVTDPENPDVLWEFPASSVGVPGFSSADYANIRGVVAIGRILVNGAGLNPESRFGVFGVSSLPYTTNPVTGIVVDGYTIRMFVLDALTGEYIADFAKNYDSSKTNYGPPGPSLADRDRDGYVDIMFYPDLNGDLQTLTLGIWGPDAFGVQVVHEDGDPGNWQQTTFFDAPFGDMPGEDAMAYNRVAVGYGWTGDLIAYYGTAGDAENRFYAICVRGNCELDPMIGEGEDIYTIGDEGTYLQDERIISSPVVINRNAFFIGTKNKYTDSGGNLQNYLINAIIPAGATFPSSTSYAVRLGAGNGVGTDIDSGAAHIITESIADTVATAQAVGESIVSVTQDGQVIFEETPFAEGDEGSGIGTDYIRILGWIEVQ